MDNPLLHAPGLPAFQHIAADHVGPAVEAAIIQHTQALDTIFRENSPDFATVVVARERADAALWRVWGTIRHLMEVAQTPQLRAAYVAAEPAMLTHLTQVRQDERLYRAYEAVAANGSVLTDAQRRAIELALLDQRLAGTLLAAGPRGRLAAITVELGELATAFANAVLDGAGWSRQILDPAGLAGLPQNDLDMMREAARSAGLDGWLVTLQPPSFRAVMSFAQDRSLRAAIYEAWGTRASDLGPGDGVHDNGPRIERILALRQETAAILGFDNFAERALASRMAENTAEIGGMLSRLAAAATPTAEQDVAALRAFSHEQLDVPDLEPWDVPFAAERQRQVLFGIDGGEIKRHLPASLVLTGTFDLLADVFGLRFSWCSNIEAWHPDVRYYAVSRDGGMPFAGVYIDLHARSGKRGGAWVSICRSRLSDNTGLQQPVAYLVCNVAPLDARGEAFLSHAELLIFLHEMGHCLHHIMTSTELPSLGGMSGVEWDAVELPSQLLENFGWDKRVLARMSGDPATGKPLAAAVIERLIDGRRHHAAFALLRQIEFSLFDLRLHCAGEPISIGKVGQILDTVRQEVAVVPTPDWYRFAHAFTHVFSGQYAAGYYSYLWAEQLSADAFEMFDEVGARVAGRLFARHILEAGATVPARQAYIGFRGRPANEAALLRRYGLHLAAAAPPG